MEEQGFRVYPYRWVVLVAYMLVTAVNQLMWITFAAVTSDSARYFAVSDLSIGLLSMSFMIVYILVALPASWFIDNAGLKKAVGLGVLFTSLFGVLRGYAGPRYGWVMVAQVGIAIGQPLILNALTTLAARWFPLRERATAAGLGTLAIYLGIMLGLWATPYLTAKEGLQGMLQIYGLLGLVAGFIFFLLMKEKPPTPPCPPEQEERALVLDGLKQVLTKRSFLLLMAVFFVGLGLFNGVTTWIEDILRPRGFSSTQAGTSGGLMILGGVVGAVVLPTLSDHFRKRVPFLIIAVGGAVVGLLGLTFFESLTAVYTASALFGFFLLAAGPVGFQYGAEIGYPAPEGTTNGLLLLMGQIAGIVFIFLLDALKDAQTGSMTFPLVLLVGLLLLSWLLLFGLKESELLTRS